MLSERVYRWLLFAYPREHRREYGEPMVQLFRDRMRRDGSGFRALAVWLHMVFDLIGSAFEEHREGVAMSKLGLMESPLPNLVYRGKVRDTHEVDDKLFLMLATDRISAFDVVLPTAVPDKGAVLCQISYFWFDQTEDIVPNHFVARATDRPELDIPAKSRPPGDGRQARRAHRRRVRHSRVHHRLGVVRVQEERHRPGNADARRPPGGRQVPGAAVYLPPPRPRWATTRT